MRHVSLDVFFFHIWVLPSPPLLLLCVYIVFFVVVVVVFWTTIWITIESKFILKVIAFNFEKKRLNEISALQNYINRSATFYMMTFLIEHFYLFYFSFKGKVLQLVKKSFCTKIKFVSVQIWGILLYFGIYQSLAKLVEPKNQNFF